MFWGSCRYSARKWAEKCWVSTPKCMLRTIQGIGFLESKCRSESRKLDLKKWGRANHLHRTKVFWRCFPPNVITWFQVGKYVRTTYYMTTNLDRKGKKVGAWLSSPNLYNPAYPSEICIWEVVEIKPLATKGMGLHSHRYCRLESLPFCSQLELSK